tara:strand:- start:148 stop:531 length:384 start_codon:yes stop_codon:yes gene_type:complete
LGLAAIWLPFFTATNVDGATNITSGSLGAPIRLARQRTTGAIRRRADGSPCSQVAPEITSHIKLIRERFGTGLMAYATASFKANPDQHKVARAEAANEGAKALQTDATALQVEDDLLLATSDATTTV